MSETAADPVVAVAREACRADPADIGKRMALAMALARAGVLDEALGLADEVLAKEPGRVEAFVLRMHVASTRGRTEEALAACEEALRLKPTLPLWSPLGAALQQAGRLEAAQAAYAQALKADPDDLAAHVNLGRLLADQGRHDAAEVSCRRAIALAPRVAAAHYGLAGVLRATGRVDEAEVAYRQALSLQPDFAEARAGLAQTLLDKLDVAGARTELEVALAARPGLESFLQSRLTLPPVMGSVAEIAAERAAYAQAVDEALGMEGVLANGARAVSSSWFYLAYHGMDDRPLMAALDRLFTAKAPDLTHEAPHLGARRPGTRVRVGFVSQYLRNHTIGRLYEGFIAGLDRSQFEVVVAHLPKSTRDPLRSRIDAAADAVLDLPPDIAEQRKQLAAVDLDVLFFTDVGMAPASYALARSRLAPLQVVGWGHPDTTGLASLDYFVSADAIEPEGAEAHYSERLIRLDRLPAFYKPVTLPAPPSRAALGLPPAGALYGCPQSLFKMHPDFDPVLAGIVRRDPGGWLVFLEGPHPAWSAALRRRWAASYPEIGARALFLPRVPEAAFLGLLAALDVLLDPPHFGSGNTLYEAMAVGAPVVTWPGAFARGRIVAGAYRQMGSGEELIVDRLEDYAARAVDLARDPAGRAALGRSLQAAAVRELLADAGALRGVEDFLTAAVRASARGEWLPVGWRPERAR